MTTWIDTHAHLYDEQFDADREAMMARALAADVVSIYLPNCDSTTMRPMLSMVEKWPTHCFPMMGLHPCYVKENVAEELATVKAQLALGTYYAVGEIGLDKYWSLDFFEEQREAFALQLDLALAYDLPVVIHSREATQDCIDIVREKQQGKLRGIFHCFSGTPEEAMQITSLGLLLGIGGVVTFKNTSLDQLLPLLDINSIVLETDAPYLSPVPFRGRRNESSYIPLIGERVAAILGMPVTELAAVTTATAKKVFHRITD